MSQPGLSALSPKEFDQIVNQWNATDRVGIFDETIPELFETHAARTPDRIALIYQDQKLTYRELNERSNQLARHLRSTYREITGHELQGDTLVALLFRRSPEMLVGIMAVLKAGAAYVPIDPDYPLERISYILEDTNAKIVMSQGDLTKISLDHVSVIDISPDNLLDTSNDKTNLAIPIRPSDLAYVIYTSGTTGMPKGVMVEHRHVSQFAIQNNFIPYNQVNVVAGISNYAFDGSVFDLFFTLLNGKTLILIGDTTILNLSDFDNQIITHEADAIFVTTAYFNSLVLNEVKSLHHLKCILFGGEVCNKEIIKSFKNQYPDTLLIHVYGPTENIVFSAYCSLSNYDTEVSVPIGRNLSDKKLYVLDESQMPVPVGITGELFVGGPGVARGYLHRPELTAERFIKNPFTSAQQPDDRLYKTGDLVRWMPDGNIEFIGRNDDQVKIRGYRIELGEIEHALLKIPGIQQACVLAKDRKTDDDTSKYLVGYYVTDDRYVSDLSSEIVSSWEDLYDSSVYSDAINSNIESDFSGWNSYVTGQPIPLSEMEEWRSDIIGLIKSLNPSDVLEIGVGTGLLMYPLLKCVKRYVGVDISKPVIERHRKYLSDKNHNVEFFQLQAAQIDKLPDSDRFDTIVINSVSQHFPGITYFNTVLEKALNKLSKGGSIFLGDIMNYDLQRSLVEEKLSCQTQGYLMQDIDTIVFKENDLMISPSYFTNLEKKNSQLVITIKERNSNYVNELSKYRYDVFISFKEGGDIQLKTAGLFGKYNNPFFNHVNKGLILNELSKSLPSHMVPVVLIPMPSFPLTHNGKLDKRSLPEPDLSNTENYTAPSTEPEKQSCRIWQNILGVNRIGITDNFFRIGGNSILATRASHQMRSRLNLNVEASDFFKYKTIAQILSQVKGSYEKIPKTTSNQSVLSFAQERLWFIEQYEQGTNAYNIPSLFELTDDADINAIKHALQQIVFRHEVLRSTIHQGGHHTLGIQVVNQEPLNIEQITFSDPESCESLLQTDINSPFNLNTEYPIRVKFYTIKSGSSKISDRTLLLLNFHHIASDGWSEDIFYRELLSYYEAYTSHDTNFRLPPLEVQYKDYAVWQRTFLTEKRLKRQIDFWKERLAGCAVLEMPTDYGRPSTLNYHGLTEEFTLSEQTSYKLRALAKQLGCTLNSVMLSALNILFGKYTGQDDIVIGSPIVNRNHEQTEGSIGFFINLQACRTILKDSQNFLQLVDQVQNFQVEAQSNQDVPFDKLIDALGIERDPSRHPLFQILFAVQRFGKGFDSGSSLNQILKPVPLGSAFEISKIDLTILIDDSHVEIAGQVNYATSLFRKNTIIQFISHFVHLVEQLVYEPEKPYSKISLLKTTEFSKVAYQWNGTGEAFSDSQTIHGIFCKQVLRTPDSNALISGIQKITYKQLDKKSDQLANRIRFIYKQKTGTELNADTLIALYFDRCPEMVLAMLAILKAGGAYVPLSLDYPQDRIDFILQDTNTAIILYNHSDLKSDEIKLPVDKLMHISMDDMSVDSEEDNLTSFASDGKAGNLAYVIYTSGTTGKPKGVMIEHQAVVSLVDNPLLEITADDTFAFLSSPGFDATTFEVWTPLLNGNALVVPENSEKLLSNVDSFRTFISTHKVSVLWLTKTLFDALFYSDKAIFKNINYLIIGGEALERETIMLMSQNEVRPRHFLNGYGPTESTTFASMYNLYGAIESNHVPIGTPLKNRTVYVLATDQSLAGIGIIGELYIGGAGLARGYLNLPELTRERFLPNPFVTEIGKLNGHVRLYRTGDLARWRSDGNLEFIGRNDDQVKLRGYRIELKEIESALVSIEGIRQACVLMKEKRTESGLNKYLAGYYVMNDYPKAIDKASIIEKLSKKLPEYMLPATLVSLKELPVTVNGKLDKNALPNDDFSILSQVHVHATTRDEIVASEIWCEALGLERVGITDDFFSLGGNSIVAIQVSHQMSTALQLDIKVSDIFRLNTIQNILAESTRHINVAGDEWAI